MVEFRKKIINEKYINHRIVALNKLTNMQEEYVRAHNYRIKNETIDYEIVECLCECETFDILFSKDRHLIKQQTVICTSCGLILSNPRMTDRSYKKFYESDEYRNIYESMGTREYSDFKYRQNPGIEILEIIKKNKQFGEIRSVLEIGAGGGWNLAAFLNEKVSVVGLELSPALVKYGQEKGIKMIHGGINNLENDSKYDIIIINHVLEHLLNPIHKLLEISSYLNHDGLFYISVPNIIDFRIGQIQNAHCYYFNPFNFKYYMAKSQLEMIDYGKCKGTHMFGVFRKKGSFPSEELLIKSKRNMYKKIREFNTKQISQYYVRQFRKRLSVN